jgi:WD40 repeat protein/tetratricopeptide (TPR) repeat protein
MSIETHPDGPATPAERLYAESLRRQAAGEALDLEDLCAAHPEHETAFRILALAEENPLPSGCLEEVEGLVRDNLGGDEKPPDLLGPRGAARYRIGREIARGGMGVIHEVWDDGLGRRLAMKVVQEPGGVERFVAEARVTGRLEHPGVVPVHELGLDSRGRAYFTMTLVEGDGLERVLRKCTAGEDGWTRTRVLGVLVRVCDTVAYAHSKGVIHRDLKPENIMVGRFGEVYVMDWGLARVAGDAPAPQGPPRPPQDEGRARGPAHCDTMRGTVLGTPAYMPPEQAAGEIETLDERSDVYAVGAMLYTLLAGRRPYAGRGSRQSTHEVVEAVLRGPPEPLHAISRDAPPELVSICERAMARAKEARYATMNALGDDLRAFLENRVVRAHRTGAMAELRKWIVRNRAVAAAIAVLIVGLTAFLVWQEVTRRELEAERNQKDGALSKVKTALGEKDLALRRSEAHRLVALSAAAVADNPTVALLLALEGAALEPDAVANNAVLAALAGLRQERTLEGHDGWIYGVDFSPDGRRVVTASADRTARVWDVATGEELVRMVSSERLRRAFFCRAGERVFTSGLGGRTVRACEAATGRVLVQRRMPASIEDLDLSPEGDGLAVSTRDGHVTILDSSTLEPMQRILIKHESHRGIGGALPAHSGDSEHHGRVHSTDFHPQGDRIVVVGPDRVAKQWHLQSERVLGTEVPDCWAARYGPEGRTILALGVDRRARVIDAETGELRGVLEGHHDWIEDIAFRVDRRVLLTGSRDTTARLWDLESGRPLAVLKAHENDVMAVAFAPDGRRAATVSYDGKVIIWRTKPALEVDAAVDTLPAPMPLLSPDGRRALRWRGRDVEVWEPRTARRIATLEGHRGVVLCAAYSTDGRRVASGAYGEARLWDVGGGEATSIVLSGVGGMVLDVAFDREGKRVATSSHENLARISDAASGKLLHVLRGHTNYVDCVAFSEDGRHLVTGSHDNTVRTWDAATGAPGWATALDGWVLYAGFFAGDELVLAGTHGNTAFLLDAETGSVRRRLLGHEGHVFEAALHAAKGLVATSSRDGTARVWDAASGEERLAIRAPEGEFRSVAFSAGGETLYTLSGDCTLRSWPLEPIAAALALRPRELSPEERDDFEVGSDEEREAHRRRRSLELFRRDRTVVRRALLERSGSWLSRDHAVARLSKAVAELTVAGERAELEEVKTLLREQARAPEADWDELSRIAAALVAAGDARAAVALLERAARMPNAEPIVASRLAGLRRKLFPDLATCASIDAALSFGSQALIPEAARWRFFRGRSEPSAGLEWTQVEFADDGWEVAAGGIGYGYPEARTVLDDMRGAYTTVYLRRRIAPVELGRHEGLFLSVLADDGFVAYLNGQEVGRVLAGEAGTRLAFDAVAAGLAPEPLVARDVPLPRGQWRDQNVLAIQGLNQSATSSDFYLAVSLRRALRVEDWAHEHGPDLLAGLRRYASEPGGACRVAYLQGRLLQLAGRHAEAGARFEAALAADRRQPEPLLRAAECIHAARGVEAAVERLRAGLASGAGFGNAGEADLWDLWCRWSFLDLSRGAAAALASFPGSGTTGEPSGPGAALGALIAALARDGTVRINCGGDGHAGTDGSSWLADAFYISGYRFHGDRRARAAIPFTGNIGGTDDDPLYRTERWFPAGRTGGYSLPLPPGRYRLTLHFAELLPPPGGGPERRFDVLVGGSAVLEGFHPGAIGPATVRKESLEVEVPNGRLEIGFAGKGNVDPAISAMEVRRMQSR